MSGSGARSMRSWWAVRQVLAVLAVFVVAGPPIGAIAFFLFVSLIGMGRGVDIAGLGWVGLFALIYGVPLSYLIGVVPAAVAGGILGLGRACLGWSGWLPAMLTGFGIGIGLQLLSGQPLPGLEAATTSDGAKNALMIGVCVAATLACWSLVPSLGPDDRESSKLG